MSGMTAPITITDQDTRTVGALASVGQMPWGQLAQTSDGKKFVYAANKSTSTALSPGQMTKTNVTMAGNHINLTGKVYAAGTTQLSYTIGATAITADQYSYGQFVVNAGTGLGQSLTIGNTNAASSAGTVNVSLIDAIITATDATSKFSLYSAPWSNVIVSAATDDFACGVPLVSITAATTALPFSVYWSQVCGSASVLGDTSAPTIGLPLMTSATAGAVGTLSGTHRTVGYAYATGVSTEYRPVYLQIIE